MSANSPSAQELQHLRQLRQLLLNIHKTLLHAERHTYEQNYGPILSNNEFFQLVISSEWFSWLRPMSQFIVKIDDVLQAKEPVPADAAQKLLEEARSLFQVAEENTTFQEKYYQSIQHHPEVAYMHADLNKLL